MSNIPIGYLIKLVYNMNKGRLDSMFQRYDLTGTQTFTLIYLFKANEKGLLVKQKDIERDMEISNPTVTGILNRLEHKGLIKRVACKKDARAKNIVVTPKALELNKALRNDFIENETMLVAALNEQEIANLRTYLIKMLSREN